NASARSVTIVRTAPALSTRTSAAWAWSTPAPTATAITSAPSLRISGPRSARPSMGLMGPPLRGYVALRTALSTRAPGGADTIANVPATQCGLAEPAPARTSRDPDDPRLDRLEPVGDQRIVARDDQPLGAGEGVDRLEGCEHLG